MKKEILERYERSEVGEIIIDISAKTPEDLYSNFDKKSHFLKKDLNQDLVEYMIESAMEIEGEDFIIRFNFESKDESDSISRVTNSINKFFSYMQEHEHRNMKDMRKKSSTLFFIGALIAATSVFINQSEWIEKSIILGVIAEGLTVAAWVSLWEALATFLVKWMPYKKKILFYERIANAKIVFNFNVA